MKSSIANKIAKKLKLNMELFEYLLIYKNDYELTIQDRMIYQNYANISIDYPNLKIEMEPMIFCKTFFQNLLKEILSWIALISMFMIFVCKVFFSLRSYYIVGVVLLLIIIYLLCEIILSILNHSMRELSSLIRFYNREYKNLFQTIYETDLKKGHLDELKYFMLNMDYSKITYYNFCNLPTYFRMCEKYFDFYKTKPNKKWTSMLTGIVSTDCFIIDIYDFLYKHHYYDKNKSNYGHLIEYQHNLNEIIDRLVSDKIVKLELKEINDVLELYSNEKDICRIKQTI